MNSEDSADAKPKAASKKIHRRAAHACIQCRNRKVRCDVAISGSPCLNCRLDGKECEVTWSRRATRYWGAKGYHPQHHTIGIRKANQTSSAKLKSDKGGRQCEQTEGDKSTNEVGGVPEFMTTSTPTKRPPSFEKSPQILQSQTHRLEELPKPASTLPRAQYSEAPTGNNDDNTSQGASRSNNWPRPGQHPCAQGIKGESQEGSTSHQDAPCSPNYITYSYYNFLSISNLYIPPQDFQFLGLRGCLRVPVRPILDEFVRQYFLHIHPMLPILDEGGFWDMYLQRSDALHNVNISLLVFQTMLFNCCNFVPQATLDKLGLGTKRSARATFYRRAKLLFDLETESSSICKAQAALLLASWSFSSYEVPRRPSTPWLAIAVQNARDSEAPEYESFAAGSEQHAVRKRLWWGCIIRDHIFSLGMRRSIQITTAQFDFVHSPPLGYHDLFAEFRRSTVHDFDTKSRLAEILELFVQLCIILTDILELAFPIKDGPKGGEHGQEALSRTRASHVALQKWYKSTSMRLPSFGRSSGGDQDHDSIILYTNLLYMYYCSTRATLGHYEILQVASTATISSPPTAADITSFKENHSELQDAALKTTKCLEDLTRLRLIGWLPVTAVSCTALPLLLHVLDGQLSPSARTEGPTYADPKKHRLGILKEAMETYRFQYEGVDWIIDTINRMVHLARGWVSSTNSSNIRQSSQGTMGMDSRTGMLAFQPSWYFRLAFAIDAIFSKGRLPDDQSLPDNFSRLLRADAAKKEAPSQDHNNPTMTRRRSFDETTQMTRLAADSSPSTISSTSLDQMQAMYEASCVAAGEMEPGWGDLFSGLEADRIGSGHSCFGYPDSKLDGSLENHATMCGTDSYVSDGVELDIWALFGCQGSSGNDFADVALAQLP